MSQPDKAAILVERERLEPELFARLRAAPAFQTLVDAGVPPDKLLIAVAWARAGRDNRALRAAAGRFTKAAAELRAAAAALERLPDVPVAAIRDGAHGTFNPVVVAAMIAARTVFLGLARDPSAPAADAEFAGLARAFEPFYLSQGLRALAGQYERIGDRLKLPGRLRETSAIVFLRNVAALVKKYSGRPHHAEVGQLYALAFNVAEAPDAENLARMIRDARRPQARARKPGSTS